MTQGFGAFPLWGGDRRGLLFSQVLTLYTTPIIYLYFDRISNRFRRQRLDRATVSA
jgi:hypothetical protein